jgi:hypothetical protein
MTSINTLAIGWLTVQGLMRVSICGATASQPINNVFIEVISS